MSRVDELIRKLCPDGVRYCSIGDPEVSVQVIAGATPKSGLAEYWEDGTIPWMSSGEVNKGTVFQTDKLITEVAYKSCSTKMVPAGAVVIALAGQGKTRGMVARTRIELCTNQSLASVIVADSMDSDFLFHFLRTQYQQLRDVSSGDGTRGGLNLRMIRAFRVPVPPLEVQREIVQILDQFAHLEAELETELEAELEARKRQYDFYRAEILAPNGEWRSTTLGEIAEIFDGPHATPKKTSSGPWYLSISSLKDGTVHLSASAHLASEDYAKWTRRVAPRPGDTLFSYETRIGQAAHWSSSAPAALGRRMGLLRPKESVVVPRFLTVAYLSPDFQALIESKTVRGSTVDRIPIADMSSWPISLPSIAEQQRIIDALDKFDALANDLSVILPGEIAARRKQYEYYRNGLLTFEEATS